MFAPRIAFLAAATVPAGSVSLQSETSALARQTSANGLRSVVIRRVAARGVDRPEPSCLDGIASSRNAATQLPGLMPKPSITDATRRLMS